MVYSYTFDFFVGALQCPVCGKTSPSDQSTNMQTKIQTQCNLSSLGSGTKLDFVISEVEDADYLMISKPEANKDIILLDVWDCPNCNAAFNWARIVIGPDKVIKNISSLILSRSSIKEANYISEECFGEAKLFNSKINIQSKHEDIINTLLNNLT